MIETITLTSFKNRTTGIADSVTFEADSETQTVKIGGETYSFISNSDYAYKVNKRQRKIQANGGYSGFIKFIKENTQPQDFWNSWLVEVFKKIFNV